MMRAALAAVVFLVSAGAACAQSVNEAGRFDYYVLALSWQPAFCRTHQELPECRALPDNEFGRSNLVLHGLWPNRENDPRHTYAYCGMNDEILTLDHETPPLRCEWASRELSAPARASLPVLSESGRAALSRVMPGAASCLEAHEWVKHGTCSELGSAEAYYRASVELVEAASATSFNRAVGAAAGGTLRAADLRAALESDFGPGNHAALLCSGGGAALSEILLFLRAPLGSGSLREKVIDKPGDLGNCGESFSVEAVAGAGR